MVGTLLGLRGRAYASDKLAPEERWMGRLEHGEKLWHEWFRDQLEPPEYGLPRMLVGR